MTKYDFINSSENCYKMTSQVLNIVTLVKGFNTIEMQNDKVAEIQMCQKKFDELAKKVKEDIFEKNNEYEKLINNMELLGAKIIINNTIDEHLVILIGKIRPDKNIMKIYIED